MQQVSPHPLPRYRALFRTLYYGTGGGALLFQSGLLALDLASIAYFLATTFVREAPWMTLVDLGLGVLLLAEFTGRLLAHRHPMAYFDNTSALIDLVVIVSLFTSFLVDNLGFLRLLRTLRLLRSYHALQRIAARYPWIGQHEEVIGAALNLAVFVLMISALVFVTQAPSHPKIVNFVDALYFTVTTLSTTGFGDIVMETWHGRLLAVAIMIVGISLFLRLAQTAFRGGNKVRFPCPRCGLQRHDHDAVHCRHCGDVLAIPDHED